jgi:hypothetical protein
MHGHELDELGAPTTEETRSEVARLLGPQFEISFCREREAEHFQERFASLRAPGL